MMRLTSTVAVVLAVALSSSCAEAQSGRAPSDSEIRLYARLMAMTDSRTLDRALVDSSLASSWAPLRAATALAIGQTGAARGMSAVLVARRLISDRDITVASNAAYALGLLRDSAGVGTLASALTGPRASPGKRPGRLVKLEHRLARSFSPQWQVRGPTRR